MTPNEKLVWAAAFADSMNKHAMPDLARFDAWRAVHAMRTFKPQPGSENVEPMAMLEEMRRDA